MTTAFLLGTGLGIGLLITVAGLAPRRPSLADALDAITREDRQPLIPADSGGWTARAGRPAAGILAAAGLPGQALRRDLAILGRAPERLIAEQATVAVTGLLLPPAATGMLAVAGLPAGWQLPAVGSLLLAAAGFAAPAVAVRQEATARRVEARNALAAFLDLVVISIAGGAGVEAALTYASAAGHGHTFGRLRQALDVAQLTRVPPWQALRQLGAELGLDELGELAATITLAGTEGARVAATLTARASAMRVRQLADAESAAQSATERMSLPLVVLFAGFLLLIGFPAVVHVVAGI